MFRIVCPSLAALLLGCALGAAEPVPALVAAGNPPGIEIPAGTSLKLATPAKAPGVESPTALAFDANGRILITESHRVGHGVEDDRKHLDWYLDDLAARTTADRLALYAKWKERIPPAHLTEKSEYVRRMADANGDGVFE